MRTVLLAISCGDTAPYLNAAAPVFKAAGADIDDIGWHDMFLMVLQKGYPEKTVLVKKKRKDLYSALRLNVTTSGWFKHISGLYVLNIIWAAMITKRNT